MFWGAFSAHGRSSLVVVPSDASSPRGGVTGASILNVLQSELPTILEPGMVFMQDNAPVHRARLVQDWLSEFTSANGVTIIGWPPYSPDMNPIENVWKLLKEKICNNHPELREMPSTIEALANLERAAVEAWEEIEDRVLQNLIVTMPHRIEALTNAGGWYTKY